MCIVRRGDTEIRMAEVADEAGVARSTVYRYYSSRNELLLDLVVIRLDAALARIVRSLRTPDDAARSLPRIILGPLELVGANPLNEALFATESAALLSALQTGPEPVVDIMFEHLGPLLTRWQDDGQLHGDLDPRNTVRWLISISLFLVAPEWRGRPARAKRKFIEQYLIRALLKTSDIR